MLRDKDQNRKYRILIADDDPIFQELAETNLTNAGFNVVSCADGAAAIGLLEDQSFDLAIVDLLMPQIDGLRLIALIRATQKIRNLPILVITSQTDPSIKAEGLRVGANDCLSKPVDWTFLPERAIALIDRRELPVSLTLP